ncbi:MAG: ABC transporter permease [Acidimicrobiales bacterium]
MWRRVLAFLPMLLGASFLVFCLDTFIPGDAAVTLAGESATPERVALIRTELNLDEPLIPRYVHWVGDAARGDLGDSLFSRRTVRSEIADRSKVTFTLVGGAILVAILLGGPLGILAARGGSWRDRFVTTVATLGVAIPNFVIGIALIFVFGVKLGWLPTSRYVRPSAGLVEWARHLVLPVLTLSAVATAELVRQLRSSLRAVLDGPLVRTAQSKGLAPNTILFKHALPLAVSPALTVLSVQAARLFGAAAIVEQIFSIDGLGRLTVDAVLNRDLPILHGIVPLGVAVALGSSLAADVAQRWLDPRQRFAAR